MLSKKNTFLLLLPISGHEAYSDKAVDAFVAYLYKGNLTFLKQMFPREDQQIAIKKILAPDKHNENIETMVECMPRVWSFLLVSFLGHICERCQQNEGKRGK